MHILFATDTSPFRIRHSLDLNRIELKKKLKNCPGSSLLIVADFDKSIILNSIS